MPSPPSLIRSRVQQGILQQCLFSSGQPPRQPSHGVEANHDRAQESAAASRRPPPTDFDFEHLKPQIPERKPIEPISPSKAVSESVDSGSSGTNQTTPPRATDVKPTTSREEDPKLPSAIQSKTSPVAESLSRFIDRAQTTLFAASQRINELTGYTGIETLKERITTLEDSLDKAQKHLHDTRLKYKAAVAERAATQREVTTLLARQKTWTPMDFERFTMLYRQDHELEASVADNAAALEEAEREAERLNRELSSGILARYHEEQIWSDKIRRMSTWGTWGLMAVNIFLFLVLQFGAEPWRRQRLVKGFEEKVREALAHERELMQAHRPGTSQAAAAAAAAAPVVAAPATAVTEVEQTKTTAVPAEVASKPEEPAIINSQAGPALVSSTQPSATFTSTFTSLHKNLVPTSWDEFFDPEHWRAAASELSSMQTVVTLRMRDVSLIALEGAAAGAAAAVASFALMFLLVSRA
ncbi:Mdm33 family-domain-containing protein [Microdochium trichocladiopsis]|uniref:Sensitive to high expression protein 9, mitochondrial n=1 Tax=Microdochium trichocladiopsis TaxID=1682393 RepID=A0A9P9BQG6_9PEZI|nr:Mdm33 family-domain-containing protein [Microdochium trichocladiopsis]KAH7030843.1 Mdm33 family-domain-containing protein [Microdochium trichocladiopsis]